PIAQAEATTDADERASEGPWPDLAFPSPPLIRVEIQGRTYTALVDTGAVVTLIAERTLFEVSTHLVHKRAPALKYADGSISPPAEVRGFTLRVGPGVGPVEAVVLFARHIDFIIGWGLIQRMQASIDSVANRLQIAGTEGVPLLTKDEAAAEAETMAT